MICLGFFYLKNIIKNITENKIKKMKTFNINSPSGNKLKLTAASIYHAIQLALVIDGFKFRTNEYFKINKI